MLPILLSVVVVSLSGVMMPGPVFAVALAKSYQSPWVGAQVSLGHAVIEVPLILLIYFGFGHFFQKKILQIVLSIVGGGMIIYMGISLFLARAAMAQGSNGLFYNAFTAGIITTGLNPFFLVWWATVGRLLLMKFNDFIVHKKTGLSLFIAVHWLCDLVWLSFVSITVYKTHSLWSPALQQWIFIACSLILIGFGGWFIKKGIQVTGAFNQG